MANKEPYCYTKLVEPDAFRLIVLYPSAALSAPIEASLINGTLFEYDNSLSDHYTALPYV